MPIATLSGFMSEDGFLKRPKKRRRENMRTNVPLPSTVVVNNVLAEIRMKITRSPNRAKFKGLTIITVLTIEFDSILRHLNGFRIPKL